MPSAAGEPLAERLVDPAEVRGHGNQAVAPPDDARDRDPDADDRRGGRAHGSRRPARRCGRRRRRPSARRGGRVTRSWTMTRPSSPTVATDSESTSDLDGEHDRRIADDPDDGRRAAGRALADGRRLLDEPARRRARRPAPRIAVRVSPVAATSCGARHRAGVVQPADDRGQVRPAHGFAALPDLDPTQAQGLCSFLANVCQTLATQGPVSSPSRTRQDRGETGHEAEADGDGFDARGCRGARHAVADAGCGWASSRRPTSRLKKVIPGMRRSALVEVVAIASRQAGRAEAVGRELAIPRAHGSYEALLADPDVDAVYIPLPNHLHAEWTIAAAARRQAVLCEKPIAMTADEAQGMVDVAHETRRAADGGVHVPPAPVVGGGARARRLGPDRAAAGRRQLVLVLQRRPGQHPQHRRVRRRGAVRHRLLHDQPVADAVRRRAGRGARPGRPRPGARRRRPDQRDPRVRRGHGDVHRVDPGRDRPAGPPVRRPRAGSRSTSRSTSRPTGRRGSASSPAATRRSPRARRCSSSRRPTRTPPRRMRSRRRCSPGSRCRCRPRTRWPTCGSSSACLPAVGDDAMTVRERAEGP